jgi:hypothetical protein
MLGEIMVVGAQGYMFFLLFLRVHNTLYANGVDSIFSTRLLMLRGRREYDS